MRTLTLILVLLASSFAKANSSTQPHQRVNVFTIMELIDKQLNPSNIDKISEYVDAAQSTKSSIFQVPEIETLGRKSVDTNETSYEVSLEQPIKISNLSAGRKLRSDSKKLSELEVSKTLSDLKFNALKTYLSFCENNNRIKVLENVHKSIYSFAKNLDRAAAKGGASQVTALKVNLFIENLSNQKNNLNSEQKSQLLIISQSAQINNLKPENIDCNTMMPNKNLDLEGLTPYQIAQLNFEISQNTARASKGYEFSVQVGYEKGFDQDDKSFLVGLKFPLGQSSAAKSEYYERQAEKTKKQLEFDVTKKILTSSILSLKKERQIVKARIDWLNSKQGTSANIAKRAIAAYRSGATDFQSFKDSIELGLDINLEHIQEKYRLENINLRIWALGGFSK